jgi:hypothetical protein
MVQEINAVAKPALFINIEAMPVMKFSNEQHLYATVRKPNEAFFH